MKEKTVDSQSCFGSHEAMGQGVGINPGRVVWSYDPNAVEWDGSGYWWEKEHFDKTKIRKMLEDAICSLTNSKTAADGWKALFAYINKRKGKGACNYCKGEKIAIKVNMNGAGGYDGDDTGITKLGFGNPVLLKELLLSLVRTAGISPDDITVYDASRIFPEFMIHMLGADGLQGVNILFRDEGGAHDAVPDDTSPINWSKEFDGDTNYFPKCVTEAEYIINMANLKGHPYGVTLCAKNHFGTIMNSSRYRPPEAANIHQFMEQKEYGKYTVLVDLMSNRQFFNKTLLYLLDGLICTYDVTSEITRDNALWQQTPFQGGYTSSIFMSQDPVAIDSVGVDFLTNEPIIHKYNENVAHNPVVENYLHEAAQISDPPSQTCYLDGRGEKVTNIGVHEHWNNVIDKQYGRNLGKTTGIELIKIENH